MEKRQYAGIATFVMRDHEYLVAIFARNGILCAETLRFQDELRDRRQLGITEPRSVPRARIAAFERAIDALTKENIPKDDLADRNAAALRALVEKKKRASKSKIRVPKPRQAHIRDDGEGDVDLLETIRHSLRHASARR
jgi:DNA end-binding protein Ku